jgi:hypothetical protein
MLAHAALALYVVVRVYNAHGVPADALTTAMATAGQILEGADITVRWVECPCEGSVGPAELVIRLVATTPASPPAALGFSYVDVDHHAGTLATVFPDRIRALARAAGADESEVLGRAMAHEIGHLILGTRDHARVGLMRGQWTSIELTNNRLIDWQFSPNDGSNLRQALVRRLRGVQTPVAVVAGARWAPPGATAP